MLSKHFKVGREIFKVVGYCWVQLVKTFSAARHFSIFITFGKIFNFAKISEYIELMSLSFIYKILFFNEKCNLIEKENFVKYKQIFLPHDSSPYT